MATTARITPEALEQKRLNREPFQTMREPTWEPTNNELRGWIEPKRAYVLMELPILVTRAEGTFERSTRLLTVDVHYQPEQLEVINYYLLAKGAKILHYNHFPKLGDPDPEKARLAQLYAQGKNKTPWDELEGFLKVCLEGSDKDTEIKALKAERDALLDKMAEYADRRKSDKTVTVAADPLKKEEEKK